MLQPGPGKTFQFQPFVLTNRRSGLDASISFEADRDENLGKVFDAENSNGTSFINATIIGVTYYPRFKVIKANSISVVQSIFHRIRIDLRFYCAGRLDNLNLGSS
jgi:hypothetical protein